MSEKPDDLQPSEKLGDVVDDDGSLFVCDPKPGDVQLSEKPDDLRPNEKPADLQLSEKPGELQLSGYSHQHPGRDSVATQYTSSSDCGNTTDSHDVNNSTETYDGPAPSGNHYSGAGAGPRQLEMLYTAATHVNSGPGKQYNENAKDVSNMRNTVTGNQTLSF